MTDNLNILSAYEKMKRYDEQMAKNNGMLGYASHYSCLDKFTSGIIPGKVYTIAAYSNVGKSRFSYGYINHFLKMGKKVCVFSLEVDKGLLFQHLCCNMYGVYNSELRIDKVNIEDFDRLYIYDDVYKLGGIEQYITDFRPDIAIIDFVQNIQVDGQSGYEAMAIVARKLQEIAISTNTTIMCLSQLSNTVARDVSSGKTDFIALKGAGEFVASSDVVLLLRMVDGNIGLTVVKTKFARKPEGEIFFRADFGKSKFTPIDDPFINKEIF